MTSDLVVRATGEQGQVERRGKPLFVMRRDVPRASATALKLPTRRRHRKLRWLSISNLFLFLLQGSIREHRHI